MKTVDLVEEKNPWKAQAARSQIAQVDGQRAVADRGRRRAVRKMYAIDQGVHRGDQLRARGALEYRSVIAYAHADIDTLRPAAAEVALDEAEFRQGHAINARWDAERAPPDPTPR
jgi:hypothetical protein